MAFNGTGTFVRLYNWVTDAVNGIKILATKMDAEMDGMATGLSNCVTKDGQTTITANIPMASHKLTGLSVGSARTDSNTLGQVQDGQFTDLGLTGGAADAYTAAPSPTIIAYAASQRFTAKIHTPNLTTTPYLQISSIATPASNAVIKKLNASGAEIAVEAGDLNGIHDFKRNVANDAFIVLNPQKPYLNLLNTASGTTTSKGLAFLPSFITISNNGSDANNDIDFSAGVFQFSDGSGQAALSALTKRMDASWVAGTNQGGLDTGSEANSTWYHCYAIYNPTTLTSDAIFTTSVSSPTLPSGYTKYKRVGSIYNDSSGNLVAFTQMGKQFIWDVTKADYSPGTAAEVTKTTVTTTTPLGISTLGLYYFSCLNSGSGTTYVRGFKTTGADASPDITNSQLIASAEGAGDSVSNTSYLEIPTNTSSQIAYRGSGGGGNFYITTQGWVDSTLI